MKAPEQSEKVWIRTSVREIYRHRNRRLYCRVFGNGREQWKALKTTLMAVAKPRARAFYDEMHLRVQTRAAADQGRMKVGDCIRLFEDRLKEGWSFRRKNCRVRKKLRPNSIRYRHQTLKAIMKSWPELARIDVRRVTEQDCDKWGNRFAKIAAPTRFNGTLGTLRFIFEEAVKVKARFDNPAQNVGRCSILPKRLTLPSAVQFLSFLEVIRNGRGRHSKNCADFVAFLAYSGARLNEAIHVEWSDIDFARRTVLLRMTKNGCERRAPMIEEMRVLLERMQSENNSRIPRKRVLLVREALKAMGRAAKKVGMPRITHHDLRHLFATVCIESGVDVPTVSRWMGHLDGGVLAMKTYGHLRDDHSNEAAQWVTFQVSAPIKDGKIVMFPGPGIA